MKRPSQLIDNYQRRLQILPLLAIAFCFLGCSGSSAPESADRLSVLGQLYGQFVGMQGGLAPQDREEFVQFVEQYGPKLPEAKELGNPQKWLVSERDGEPFVIVLRGQKSTALPEEICIHEAVGVGGVRLGATSDGESQELGAEQ